MVDQQIEELNHEIEQIASSDEACQRLRKIPTQSWWQSSDSDERTQALRARRSSGADRSLMRRAN
jgi:hypothetical protein